MAPPALPQELLDQIVDHAWADRSSLRACNAASRLLAPTARTHLFHTITLNGPAILARFERLVLGQDPAQYVRTLRVVADHFSSYRLSARLAVDNTWLARVPAVVSALPALRGLELESISWTALELGPKSACAFFDALYRIERLSLTNVHFGCSSQVQDVLAVVANLTELRCDRVYWSYWSAERTHAHAHSMGLPNESSPPPLRRLVIRPGSPTHLFTDWLLPPGRELQIRELDVHWCERELAPVLGDLLRITGPHLESLFLELSRLVGEEILSPASHVDLSANPNLRRVLLDGTVLPGCSSWVCALVAQLASKQLETIDIVLLASCLKDLHTFDWPLLNRALAHPRFKGVQLKFDISLAMGQGRNTRELAHDIIYEALPEFRSRGKLLVRCQ